MYSIKKCESPGEIDEAKALLRQALPESKDITFFLAQIADKAIAAVWLRLSGDQAEIGPVVCAGDCAEDGVEISLARAVRDEAVMRGAKQVALPDGKIEILPCALSYMCKVCGCENKYVSRVGAMLKCVACGYITPCDNIADIV